MNFTLLRNLLMKNISLTLLCALLAHANMSGMEHNDDIISLGVPKSVQKRLKLCKKYGSNPVWLRYREKIFNRDLEEYNKRKEIDNALLPISRKRLERPEELEAEKGFVHPIEVESLPITQENTDVIYTAATTAPALPADLLALLNSFSTITVLDLSDGIAKTTIEPTEVIGDNKSDEEVKAIKQDAEETRNMIKAFIALAQDKIRNDEQSLTVSNCFIRAIKPGATVKESKNKVVKNRLIQNLLDENKLQNVVDLRLFMSGEMCRLLDADENQKIRHTNSLWTTVFEANKNKFGKQMMYSMVEGQKNIATATINMQNGQYLQYSPTDNKIFHLLTETEEAPSLRK
jgi:hypothetical protein